MKKMSLMKLKDIKKYKKEVSKMTDMTSLIEDVESTLTPYYKEIERLAFISKIKYDVCFVLLKFQYGDLSWNKVLR